MSCLPFVVSEDRASFVRGSRSFRADLGIVRNNKQRPAAAAASNSGGGSGGGGQTLTISDILTNKNVTLQLQCLTSFLFFFLFIILTGRAVSDGQGALIWSYAMLHLNCILEKTSSSTTCFTYLQ